MPGVVSLPHGWGHDAAAGWRTAATPGQTGVNVNLLAGDGPAAAAIPADHLDDRVQPGAGQPAAALALTAGVR